MLNTLEGPHTMSTNLRPAITAENSLTMLICTCGCMLLMPACGVAALFP